MPTSITVAPGLSQSPRTISGPADGGDDDVGAADGAGRSRVREWAMVTVQFARSSSCAIGLPTMFERPTTTASRPAEVAELLLAAACRQPSGVQGTSAVQARSRAGRR